MKKHILLSLLLITCLLSCDKEEADRGFARVNTLGVGMITANGVSIKGEIYDAGSKTIEDHGFIYNLQSRQYDLKDTAHFEGLYEKESLGSTSGNSVFETQLSRNLIKGETYLAKAYAVTDGTIVYGENLEFISHGGLGPVITSFSPDTLEYGDTLTIKGVNFSVQSLYNKVLFDEIEAEIVSATDTSLHVIFPKGPRFKKCPFRVEVAEQSINSANKVVIAAPKIDSISQSIVFSNDYIKVYGKNFTRVNEVMVGGKFSQSYYYSEYQSDSLLSFRIPNNLPIGKQDIKFEYLDDSIVFPKMIETILPTIDSFSPKQIWLDSVITIRGTNLKRLRYLRISGNNAYDITDTLAYCRIYNVPESNKIRGYYDSHDVVSKDSIEWFQPKGNSFSVSTAKAKEPVYLYGDNFFYGLDVYFGNTEAYTRYLSKTTLEVHIPEVEAGTYHPTFKYGYSGNTIDPTIKAKASISIPQVRIINVTPLQVKRGSTISVTVENANLNNSIGVYVDGKYCRTTEKTGNIVTAIVPVDHCLSSTPKVSVSSGGQKVEYHTPLQLSDPWQCMPESEYWLRFNYITQLNDKEIAIKQNGPYGHNRNLSIHDGENQWSELSDIDFNDWIYNIHAYEDKIYFPTGVSDKVDLIRTYSTTSNEWEILDTIPSGKPNYSFLIDDKLYVGNTKGMSYLNLTTKEWVTKSHVPSSEYYIDEKILFTTGKKAYLCIHKYMIGGTGDYTERNEFWVYDSENDIWSELGEVPIEINEEATAAVHNDKAYIAGRGYRDEKTFWEYDTSSDTWKELIPPPGLYRLYTSFIKGDEYFFGCNYHNSETEEDTFVMSKIPIANMQEKEE
jgi:hypothetical protein